jgi:predicted flavoprotein YhiN
MDSLFRQWFHSAPIAWERGRFGRFFPKDASSSEVSFVCVDLLVRPVEIELQHSVAPTRTLRGLFGYCWLFSGGASLMADR